MKIHDYVVIEQKRLEAFKAWWYDRNAENPAHFPADMSEEEWFEQFLSWNEETK